MNDSILKYIAEEKDIAKYKISLLNKGSKKQYKTRLISIEKDFIDYVYSFYGSYDAIYQLHHIVTNQKLSKQIIKMAVNVYENTINFRGSDTFTWGDGDSIDRERGRNILENDFLFKEVQN